MVQSGIIAPFLGLIPAVTFFGLFVFQPDSKEINQEYKP